MFEQVIVSQEDDSYATLRPGQPTRAGKKPAPVAEEDEKTLRGGGSPGAPVHITPPTPEDAIDAEFEFSALTQKPAETLAAPTSKVSLQPGSTFGDYEIIREIDRGGMGIVVLAKQTQLNRTVAIKMILAGTLAGDADIKRFYTEAEASAELDHPGIVPIYDIGEIDGLNYYSMRFIEGPSLSSRVSEGPLEVDEAAQLSQQIADAVSYAHERGIVHRDLKPANVLLDLNGDPVITDFGLAKKLDDDQGLTGTGQVIGTPGYMPPEQAMGEVREIGPRSDIYSVGAILYCLLTGRAPFHAASIMETLHQVIKNEPVAPRQLNPSVPIDLETICLKCLNKQQAQRYQTARELADDLQRYVEGKPVQARPISGLQRFQRWCKRNPVVAALSLTSVLALVVGTVVSTVFAFAAADRAREAEANLLEAQRQQAKAEANFRMAREAVDEYFTQVSENTLLNQPGMQSLQQDLLGQALAYYRQFLVERADDPDIQDDLAGANFRVGLINEAVEADLQLAIEPLKSALEIQRRLATETPDDVDRAAALSDTLTALGRIQFRSGQGEASIESLQEALTIRRSVAESSPEDATTVRRQLANSHMNVGLVEMEVGNLEAAREQFEQAQEIRQDILSAGDNTHVRRDFGMGYYNLGNLILMDESADLEVAFSNFESAVEVFQRLIEEEPRNFSNQSRLAVCHRILGDLQSTADDITPALASYREAMVVLNRLVSLNPDVTQYREQLAGVQINRGQLLLESDAPEALAAFQQADSLLLTLAEEAKPENDALRAVALRESGLLLIDQGDVATGQNNFDQAEQIQKELVKNYPDNEAFQLDLQDTEALRPAQQHVTPEADAKSNSDERPEPEAGGNE